jgi:hypothetical protein
MINDNFQKLKNLLFIDIETASACAKFEELSEAMQALWARKAQKLQPNSTPAEAYPQWAALFSEFGKIITIGLGYFLKSDEGEVSFRVKALQADDEAELLAAFCKIVEGRPKMQLVAHNGLEFDYPYIARRIIINGLAMPKTLEGLSKRDVKHLDTLQMWKFGEYRNFTSLALLCEVLGVPSSKQDLDGSKVGAAYHEEKDLVRIAQYCQNDVIATARVFLRLGQLGTLAEEQIFRV